MNEIHRMLSLVYERRASETDSRDSSLDALIQLVDLLVEREEDRHSREVEAREW